MNKCDILMSFFCTGIGESCNEADTEYVKEFYDQIAENFEQKLVLHLGYRGPWILYDLVVRGLRSSPLVQRVTGTSTDCSPHPNSRAAGLRIFDLGYAVSLDF
jgi:hypothetical protein